MLIRYHYGLGVGHIYVHSAVSTDNTPEHNLQDWESEEVGSLLVDEAPELEEGSNSGDDVDIASDSEDSNGSKTDDDELLAMHEMYGPY
jgi:hypothetical protein